MPVDSSMYNTQYQPPANPLSIAQSALGLQHSQGENQLQQMDIRSRNALGAAIQASSNPDGSINTNKLTQVLAQNPDGARILLQAQRESQAGNALTHYVTKKGQSMQAPLPQVMAMNNPDQQVPPPDQDTVDKWHAHTDALINTLQPLANDNNLDQRKIIGATTDLVADPNAQFSNQDAAAQLSQLPYGPNGTPAPPQVLKQGVNQVLQKAQQNKAILSARFPSSAQLRAKKVAASLAEGNGQNEQQPQQSGPSPTGNGYDPNNPGTATSMPMGYERNQASLQDHFNQVRNDANSVGQSNAVLENIMNLSKSGAPTGTLIGRVYQYLADKGLAPPGVEDSAEQLQEITKYMGQAAISGGIPGSDSRLEALQEANTHPEQLPGTIQNLVPFLEAVNKSKLARAQYYEKVAGNGLDPDKVQQAQSNWNANVDPRVFEYQDLPASEKAKFVQSLSPQEASELSRKRQQMKSMGVLQ